MAAEGTRSKSEYWKSGFYRIAQQTGLPITLAFLDAPSKTVGWGPTFMPSGDVKADMDRLREFFADKRGFNPDQATEPRLKEEDTGVSRGPQAECRRGESNPHALGHTDLNRTCLPVPPLRRGDQPRPRSLRSFAT